MAKSNYVSDLEAKLEEVDRKIVEVGKRLESGTVEAKAHALSELSHLRQQHEDLAKRIEEAKARGAEQWRALHMSFQEEADALIDTLNSWLTRYD
jgi:peptidoglycan hydrolase CwlO-like protein